MAGPIIVPAEFLHARADAWSAGWTLVGPDEIACGLPEHVRKACEVMVTAGSTFDPALVEALPSLRLVACFSTGIEAIDTDLLRRTGIQLTTAAGVNAHDVADHAFALMLAQWHGVPQADAMVRGGGWQQGFRQELAPRPSLKDRRAGVVGLGRIGSEIARRASAHAMDVRWWGPRDKPGADHERMPNLLSLAEWADVLFLACAVNDDNAGLIDRQTIDALGADGLLVNITRGMLVDEAALRRALVDGRLGGAALDVFLDEPTDHTLWHGVPHTLFSPHIAGFTQEAGRDMFAQLRENVRRYFAGEPLLTPYFA